MHLKTQPFNIVYLHSLLFSSFGDKRAAFVNIVNSSSKNDFYLYNRQSCNKKLIDFIHPFIGALEHDTDVFRNHAMIPYYIDMETMVLVTLVSGQYDTI